MTPNYFENKAFEQIELVKAINLRKHKPMQAGALNLFRRRGSMSTKISVEERGSAVSLIQTSERATPASQYTAPKRTVRLTKIPYIKRESTIQAEELRDLRAFGSETAQANLEQTRNEHLEDLGDSVDVTHEHMLMGALRGELIDADNAVLLNLFDFFDVSQEGEIAFDLATTTEGALTKKVREMIRLMKRNLGADAGLVRGVHAFCHSSFMDDLVAALDFRESLKWDPSKAAQLANLGTTRSIFWNGVTWEEYDLGDSGLGGTWVAADKAIFFPVGPAIYDMHFAPAPFFASLDAPGLPMYARSARDPKWDDSIELRVESCPLPIVTRPKALLRGKRGA